jgi:hypothetical protein
MNNQDFINRFNLARNQIRTQLGIIERAFAAEGWDITGIQAWWDIVLDDFLSQLETRVRTFTNDAIAAAFAPYNTQRGQQLRTYNTVRTTLTAWQNMVDNNGQGLTLDGQFFVNPQQPPPPPGDGGLRI